MNRTFTFMSTSIIAVLLIMLSIIFVRMLIFKPITHHVEGKPLQVAGNFDKQINRFSRGLQFKTVSAFNSEEIDSAEFCGFINYLNESYPILQTHLDKQAINEYALVYRWPGEEPSLNPILFLSHYDVVPAGNGWTYAPFSGTITDEYIYGRGTLDMKSVLFSLLDATEILIEKGFKPKRDIYFAFGHDEEVGGVQGASQIVTYLKKQCLTFDAVFDEGGLILPLASAGVDLDVAMIGVAEKGKSTIRLKTYDDGGHASMPPNNTTLGTIACIITQLESNQMQSVIIDPVFDLLCNISGNMPVATRLALANRWLFEPFIINEMQKHPLTAAMMRTTTAVTMACGSNAVNVLPAQAETIVNFRILPGNTVNDVQKHVQHICAEYPVEIELLDSMEPSPVSPITSKGYQQLVQTIRQVYPNAAVTPGITVAATDASKYYQVSPNIYRFIPVQTNEQEQRGIHNINERISIDNYKRMIYFYEQLMMGYDED